MNRKDLIRSTAAKLREQDIKKPISSPKKMFYISDEEGNTKEFVVKRTDKSVIYTADDVDAVVTAMMDVIKEELTNGRSVTIRGFGSLNLQHRKARATKHPDTGEPITIEARWVPKLSFGNELRLCAKLYELSLGDGTLELRNPSEYDDPDENDDEEEGDE